LGIEAAGVDQRHLAAREMSWCVVPVARDAGRVVDDGQRLSRQPIEERALADVGAPDHRHDRRHDFSPLMRS
jgi:hypothetical protein